MSILWTIAALAAFAVAITYVRRRKTMVASLLVIGAICLGLLAFWSSQTVGDEDGDHQSADGAPVPTVPQLEATPGQ